MKQMLTILLTLTAFTGLHALLRLLYFHEMTAYEMSLPNCCHAMSLRSLRVAAAGDFCFYWPSPAHPDFNSVAWGGAATLLCLACGGWHRRAKRAPGKGRRRPLSATAE